MNKIKIAYSITLYNVLNTIIFEEVKDEKPVERKLPFGVKFKLQKNLNLLAKDYAYFEEERNNLIKQYGEEKDGKITVKEENIEVYKNDLMKILDMEVEHKFEKLTTDEVKQITDVDIECYEMEVFINYLTENE